MANKKISELQSRTPALSDLMLVGDPSSGYSYKCTVTALATIIETDIADGFVTIGTTQTISGAKTFSNNLTLTSVANTPTDPDKFLTLNASNVVTYRTGSQVLSDIGGQGSITLTTTGTSGAATLVGNTLNIPQYQAVLSGTGIVKSTGGTISYLTDNSTNWNSAYDNMIVSAAVTGTTTKTLTLTQQDSGTITASWTDDNSGTVTSVGLSAGTSGTDVNVSGSPITSSGTITLNIPTASATNRGALSSTDWSTFNNKQSAITLTTTGSSGSATFVSNTLNVPTYTLAGLGGISGSGTTNYIPKFTSSSAIGNSIMQESSSTISIAGTGATSINVRGASGNGSSIFFTEAGIADRYLIGTPASSGDLVFRSGAYDFSSGSERLRISSTGNVGINTSSPSYKLDVNGQSRFAGQMILSGVGSSEIYTSDASGLYLTAGTAAGMYLQSDGIFYFRKASSPYTEYMRVSSTGNVSIGNTNNTYKLDVTGTGRFMVSSTSQNQLRVYSSDATATLRTYSTSDGDGLILNQYYAVAGSPYLRSADFVASMGDISSTQMRFFTKAASSNPAVALTIASTGAATFSSSVTATAFIPSSSTIPTNGLYLPATNTLGFATNSTERMRLDASGNLGLGTSSPESILHIAKSNSGGIGAQIILDNNGSTALNNAVELSFLTDAGASGTGVRNARIQAVNENASNGAANLQFWTWNGSTDAERLRLTASGNLGLGVTPSAWTGTFKALQIGLSTSLYSNSTGNGTFLGSNFYYNGTNNIYLNSNTASAYGQSSGQHQWFTAPSGTAGNVISFTQAMTLDASGRLGIGTTSPSSNLSVRNEASSGISIIDVRGGVSGAGALQISGNGTTLATTSFDLIQNSAGAFVLQRDNNPLTFGTNNTERMRITSGGNVGINGTSPSGSLDIYGNTGTKMRIGVFTDQGTDDPTLQMFNGKNTRPSYSFTSDNTSGMFGGSGFVAFSTSASERMRITSGGELLINTTSDAGDYKLQVNGNSYLNGITKITKSVELPHTTKSAAYTLTSDDYTVGFNVTSASITATLPDATTCAGRIYVIYQYNTGNGARGVTIDGNGAQTINGIATYSLLGWCDFSSVILQSDGSNWIILSDAIQSGCL